MTRSSETSKNSMVGKGFELDKGLNKLAIAAGIGVSAVGAVVAAPAIVTFGAVVAGGSAAGLVFTDRLKRSYEKHQSKK